MKRILIFALFVGLSGAMAAQKQVRQEIRSGNKDYKKEKYTDAEVAYRRALQVNTHSTDAAYNLGNALYRQGKGEAAEQYRIVTENEKDKSKLAATWHNIGNTFMSARNDEQKGVKNDPEMLKRSIEAYKNSLRNNPRDDETRYNLALAQKLLKDQQQQQQDNQQQQKQDQQQQEQQQKQQQQEQKDQQQPQDQQQQNSPNEMSQQSAEQILDAMMQEEKNTQERMKQKQMQQQKQRRSEKNW